MTTITICSSANFYRHVVELQEKLEGMGYTVLIPHNAQVMKESGDYNVDHYKTWFADAKDYTKKAALMHRHFDEVDKGDVVLVVNNEKHGIPNYIGGNVLMEMAVGFHAKKPIVVFNDIPAESNFLEEILGMQPIVLNGKVEDLPAKLGS